MPPRVGTILQFVGGALGRAAISGLILGLCFLLAGGLPWQLFVGFFQNPPPWMGSVWFAPGLVILGLVLIGSSLWFNLWSKKQQAIDELAEDMAWAITNLLNRNPRPAAADQVAEWERDFMDWCSNVSRKLENRAFFTRADQIHFDMLGFVEPIAMADDDRLNWLLSMLRLKFDRLRDVINWTQQRRR